MRGRINHLAAQSNGVVAGSTDGGSRVVYSTETFEVIEQTGYPQWARTFKSSEEERHSELPGLDEVKSRENDSKPKVGLRPDVGLIWASKRLERSSPEHPGKFVRSADTTIDVHGTELIIPRRTNDVLVLPDGGYLVSAHDDDWMMERMPLSWNHPRALDCAAVDPRDMLAMVRSAEEDRERGRDDSFPIQIWDLQQRVRLRGIEAPSGVKQLIGLRGTPGHFVAIDPKQVGVFSVEGGPPVRVVGEEESKGALAAAIDEEGRQLAVATARGLLLYSTVNWNLQKKVEYGLPWYLAHMALVSEYDIALLLIGSSLQVVQLDSGRCWRTVSDRSEISSFGWE
jgi:hypothetical protein